MKYNKGFAPITILVIVLLAGVIGGVAYYAGKNTSSAIDNPIYESENNNQVQNGPILTQAQAEVLVHQIWSDCSLGDCSSVAVSVTQNSSGQYVVTGIFTELDDSISQTKRISVALYQNGTWTLGQPTVTRMCHRGNADGTTGWTAGLCI